MNCKSLATAGLLSGLLLGMVACTPNEDEQESWLQGQGEQLDDNSLGGFEVPNNYDLTGAFAPGAYNGQVRRLAQLQEIKDSLNNEPIFWDLRAALVNENRDAFRGTVAQGNSDLRTKIDELNFDSGDTGVADAFAELADRLVRSSQDHYTVTAADGRAGMITTRTTRRHVSANGLEYAQMLEKGLYGAIFYDQMVDDYLRDSQAGSDNEAGNNRSAVGSDYDEIGTDRQHRWDEAFGYLGADPLTYPNPDNTSNGDGSFIANYMFDFSDETFDAFGVDLAQRTMDAFILGRAALKAGEGFGPVDETTNEEVFEAARADVKLYVEASLVAAALHYLNSAIADITDEDKIHHLSEALAFIYCLTFTDDGRIRPDRAYDALEAMGWPADNSTLTGMYEVNLWQVTDQQMENARAILDKAFPGFGDVPF